MSDEPAPRYTTFYEAMLALGFVKPDTPRQITEVNPLAALAHARCILQQRKLVLNTTYLRCLLDLGWLSDAEKSALTSAEVLAVEEHRAKLPHLLASLPSFTVAEDIPVEVALDIPVRPGDGQRLDVEANATSYAMACEAIIDYNAFDMMSSVVADIYSQKFAALHKAGDQARYDFSTPRLQGGISKENHEKENIHDRKRKRDGVDVEVEAKKNRQQF
ncbi:hypothetical protein PTI98_007202 [Pleurotus ostreatus]|nr:hypothetical protein PTI98_010534 [Pleurotus ostreatus]KAJ8694538.1 hypothetical protein PTI98_007202 [Pleurotus ostreatus]